MTDARYEHDDPFTELEEESLYDHYRVAFSVQLTDSLVDAVTRRHHTVAIDFGTELRFAKAAFEEAHLLASTSLTGWMNLVLVSWVRSYRAIDWYLNEVGQAIADAMSEPFAHYIRSNSTAKARDLFKTTAMRGMRDSVLEEAFKPVTFLVKLNAFFNTHGMRNKIVHGTYVPTIPEARQCLSDAVELHDLLDARFNPSAPAPVGALAPST